MNEIIDSRGFSPNWRTHPGEHVEEILEARGWTQAELARQAGMTPKLVSEIVSAKNPVTPETAMKLQRVLGLKAEIWLSLQAKWDLHEARAREKAKTVDFKPWLAEFPLRELKTRGVLPNTRNDQELCESLCQFFGIGEPNAFSGLVRNMAVQHRQSKAGEVVEGHVWSWLMLGEIRAAQVELPPFDKDRFLRAITEIRGLTTQPPEIFEPKMRELCRHSGVALVFEKPISKTKLFGSARWFNADNNALIQLSLRMKSNDHLWWTFFHECGHIILHKGKNFADDQNGHGDGLEDEADKWAEKLLYGSGGVSSVIRDINIRSAASITQKADELGLHPGILVGMLQHYREIPFAAFNNLKVKFEWTDEVEE